MTQCYLFSLLWFISETKPAHVLCSNSSPLLQFRILCPILLSFSDTIALFPLLENCSKNPTSVVPFAFVVLSAVSEKIALSRRTTCLVPNSASNVLVSDTIHVRLVCRAAGILLSFLVFCINDNLSYWCCRIFEPTLAVFGHVHRYFSRRRVVLMSRDGQLVIDIWFMLR